MLEWQNCCIWGKTNPRQHLETPLHSLTLSVWCEVQANDTSSIHISFKMRKELWLWWMEWDIGTSSIHFCLKKAEVKHHHLMVPTGWCKVPLRHPKPLIYQKNHLVTTLFYKMVTKFFYDFKLKRKFNLFEALSASRNTFSSWYSCFALDFLYAFL